MKSIFAILFFVVTATSFASFAELPVQTQSGLLIANAKAKGYTFKIEDMTMAYEPKFVSEAKVRMVFSLVDIRKNDERIDVIDDRNDSERISKIRVQFDTLCTDIFDIKEAKIPEAQVRNVQYVYLGFKVSQVSCAIFLPAK